MLKRLTAVLLFVVCANVLHTQPPAFRQSYHVLSDVATKGYHTNTLDGGMILITRASNVSGTQYFSIFKTQNDGNLQWSQRYVQPGNCSMSNIVQLPDSTYFFCFVELNFPENYYIIHLDAYGNLLYSKVISPPSNYIVAYDPQCAVRNDGNVYITSDLFDQTTGMMGWHLFEVDRQGAVVFSNCYNGGTLKCLGRSIALCANGDLVMTGYQRDSIAMHYGPVITRIDSGGNLLWSTLFLDSTIDIAGISVTEMSNGDLVAIGTHTSPGYEVIRIQLDASGNLLRSGKYTSPGSNLSPYTAALGENNTLLIMGTTDSGSFCMKLDTMGNVMHTQRFYWIVPGRISISPSEEYRFSGVQWQTNRGVIFTSDTTLISCFGITMMSDTAITAFTPIAISRQYAVALGDSDFVFASAAHVPIVTKDCGNVGIEETAIADISIYPVPASEMIRIRSRELIETVQLADVNGRTISCITVHAREYNLDTSELASGMYLLQIADASGTATQKIIIEH